MLTSLLFSGNQRNSTLYATLDARRASLPFDAVLHSGHAGRYNIQVVEQQLDYVQRVGRILLGDLNDGFGLVGFLDRVRAPIANLPYVVEGITCRNGQLRPLDRFQNLAE